MCEPNPDTRVVLPPPDELPDAVRAAISMAAPAPRSAPPTNAYLPVGTLRAHVNARARGRRAARNPHEPDLVIDADRGTVTRASGADVASWHVEWGDLPALIAGPREANGHNVVNGRVNGSSGRHRN